MSTDTLPKIAQALRLLADALDSEPVTPVPASTEPDWLDETQLFDRYGLKKASADARKIPRKRIGRKSRWARADVEAAIAAQPVVKARPPRKSRPIASDMDPLDAMLANGELRATRGAR